MRFTARFWRACPPVCLAISLALSAHAQSDVYSDSSSSSGAVSASALPDAPVAPATLPIVSGRPYRPPTAKENLVAYRRELIGFRPFLSAGFRAGLQQARTRPTGWGQDFPGYGQRYGSAYGESAINNSVRFGLAAVFHEDVRYLICHKCSAHDKIVNAMLAEVTARHGADGHRTFSATPIIANFSGPLVAYAAWYPPGYGPDDAARHSTLGLGTRIGFRLVREFLLDRDNKQEKAAKQSAADVSAAKATKQ